MVARAKLLYSGENARPGERKLPLPEKNRAISSNGSIPPNWAVKYNLTLKSSCYLPVPRHLGASSHSGNARGDCRGCWSITLSNHRNINKLPARDKGFWIPSLPFIQREPSLPSLIPKSKKNSRQNKKRMKKRLGEVEREYSRVMEFIYELAH